MHRGNGEARNVAGRERPDAEQAELDHRLGDSALDHDERREQHDATSEQAEDRGRPAR
jgi:hypothetical protein